MKFNCRIFFQTKDAAINEQFEFQKKIQPIFAWIWLKLGLQLLKDMLVGVTGEPSGYSEHTSWQAWGIWERKLFSGTKIDRQVTEQYGISQMLR